MILSTSRNRSTVREYPKEIFNRSFFSRFRVGEKFGTEIRVLDILSAGVKLIRRKRFQIRRKKTDCIFI